MADRVHVWVQEFQDRVNLSLQWRDPLTGKRRTKTAGTADRAEAERRAADWSYELAHGLAAEPSRMTWKDFRALFEAEFLAGRRAGTVTHYRQVLGCFEEICAPGRLAGVTARTLSQFLTGMRARPGKGRPNMAPNTCKVYLQLVTTALRWAVKQGFLPRTPEAPTVKVPKKRPQPVPAEAFEKLLAKVEVHGPDWRAFLLCGWLAGLRAGESYALEWVETDQAPWVDFGRRRILFPAEAAKGDEDQWVPLDPALAAELERLPRAGRKVFSLRGPSGKLMKLGSVCDRICTLAKRAGVKLSSHSMRKGFGCRYAAKAPAQVLQRLMRHSTIQVTMDFYANIDDAIEEAVLGPKDSAERSKPDPARGKKGKHGDATRSRNES